MSPENEKQGGWIKEILIAVVGLVIGMLLTYITAVSEITERTARLETQVESLSTLVQECRLQVTYSPEDARRDLALLREEIRHNAEQISQLRQMFERHVDAKP